MITVKLAPDEFVAKCAELKTTQGIDIDGPVGMASKDGVSIKWCYDQAAGKLTCEVVKKPMLMPLAVVEGRLKAWLAD